MKISCWPWIRPSLFLLSLSLERECQAGIRDILILEATPRIGGRVMKTTFSGYTVEMGANWLFGGGPMVNPVLEMAKKIKLRTYLNDYENITSNTYKQEGGLYPKKLVDEVEEVAAKRDKFNEKFSQILSSKKKDVDVSILAAQRIFSKQVPKTPLEMVIDYYHNDYEDAEPPRMTSLKHTWPREEFVDHGSDPYFVSDPRGFETVVQYLAKQFLSPLKGDPRLKLNKVVKEIIYSKEGVAVITEDGSIYKAKYAIVSVSVGVLQSDLIEFKPKLPLWKRVAIADYSMTIYTKIFLKFPYKFWPSGPGTEFFLYTHERRGYYALWQHLEFEYPGSNILMVTATADESRRIEQLADKEIEAEIMEVLKKMFGDNVPKPQDMLVPRWGTNSLLYWGASSQQIYCICYWCLCSSCCSPAVTHCHYRWGWNATPRIGGRMMKTSFSGYNVELGANWLFGGGNVTNPVLEMGNKVNLRTYLNDYENITANTYKEEGGLYSTEVVEEVEKVAAARDEFCEVLSGILSNQKGDVDISILGAQRIFQKAPKTPLENVIDYYHNDYEDGEPPKETSLKHTYPRNEFVDHGEDPLFVSDPRGFEIVPQYLAKQFLSSLNSDPRLRLNKVVTEINYKDSGVEPWKKLAIADYSMTIYTKIFLKFPYAFWPTGNGTEFFLYTHRRRGYYPVWQHLENEYPGSNILFVTVTGRESRRVEQLSDEEVQAEIMEILKKLFGDSIPDPEDILVPRWGQSRFYKGSYSNWPARYTQKRHDQLAVRVVMYICLDSQCGSSEMKL
ncbi:hypothetical protein Tsubulata_030974 [Turnera subulata]|uniref:Amine oxidase domain-containing protein n=1 Tax=Turnera subulata TaxID=218843 RepID=A0A9Q0FCN1_9ROSI|nr:hypothetical protein Tsubulata_030974 [Turnera subulata]